MGHKILIVVEAALGGVARHVVDQGLGLANRGHHVHVLYSPLRADLEMLAPLMNDERIATAAVAMKRHPGFRDVTALLAIRRYMAEQGPFDVVHGHSTKGALGCIAALGRPAARVFTAHGMRSIDHRLKPLPRHVFTVIERFLMRFAHLSIAVSEFEQAHAIRMGFDASRLRIVVNGVGPAPKVSREEARARIGLVSGTVAVGYVGRLSSEKGPDRAIDAFHDAASGDPQVRLVMIGYGPLETVLKERAEVLGIAERVMWVNEGNGRALMPALDILALPSAYEGMPYVLLEAASAGLPIVATEVGGAHTIVKAGENGYVVPNWDRAAFAGRLKELLADRALRQRMAASSRRRGNAFGVDRMVDETLAVYASATDIVNRSKPVAAAGGSLPKSSTMTD